MARTTEELITEHIISRISSPRPSEAKQSPLFVGLQGPQGSGKTTVTNALLTSLATSPHNLHVVVLSIDDLYLPYEGLRAIAESNPGNGLLNGRGHAGTHDVELGADILKQLQAINSPHPNVRDAHQILIPKFEKSAHEGYGDRAPREEWTTVRGPVDVVLLEGWCFGFYPLPEAELQSRWERREGLGVPPHVRMEGGVDDMRTINDKLEEYVKGWYSFFTCFIQIAPPASHPYEYIYRWRLQQEHAMKAKNGGRGMSDEQVITFVDRYIPGYAFFADGVQNGHGHDSTGDGTPPWHGCGLKVTINEARDVISTQSF